MPDIKEAKKLLDEINAAVASYDPMLKEQARDILLKQAFGTEVKNPSTIEPTKSGAAQTGTDGHTAFHQLVEKWTPQTQAEWVLLGSYFVQVVEGNESFTALQVNKELKQHGQNVANITASLEENVNQTPALVRQIGKSGKSQQARKKYVLTTQGINFVKVRFNESKKS
jgi:hypothetical protein